MYWILFSLIILITIFFFGGFIITVKDGDDEAHSAIRFGLFIATCACGLVIWGFIENKTYDVSKPLPIQPTKVSIMKDKEVAIIRYKDFQKTFESKKEYDAISDSSFVLEETVEYNIQGEENGRTYNLVVK